MDARQETDLRDAFDKAFDLIRSGEDIALVETTYDGYTDSAALLVVGRWNTRDAVKVLGKLIERWKAAAEFD